MTEPNQMEPYPAPQYFPPYQYGPLLHEQKNNLGIWALILGIASLMLCGMFSGIPAIILGRAGEKAQDQGLANNRALARTGWILGIVGTAFWALMWLLMLLSVVLPLLLAIVLVGTAASSVPAL